ncbi:MAG TPA: GAF domain-containing protein [Nocardioides sp.]
MSPPSNTARVVTGRDLLYTIGSARTAPWSVLVPLATSGVLPALSFISGVLGSAHQSRSDIIWLTVGCGGILLTALLGLLRRWARALDARVDLDAAAQLRVALQDALQPLAENIAMLPALPKRRRHEQLKLVCTEAASALTMILRGVDRVRAVIYELNEDGTEMPPVAHHGRGDNARTFVRGTPRGDNAIDLVLRARTVFYEDLANGERPVFVEGAVEYKTFISVAIHAHGEGYGMLTVDAPRAGALTHLDQHVVKVIAAELAIAFSCARN